MTDYLSEAQALFPQLVAWRRDFHRHPELSFKEVRTAGIVADHLNSLGLEVTTGVGKTGVVGILEGGRPGPTVMLRFDMDALPIQEIERPEYVSQNDGVMHACGHDGHTAIGMGVATLLTRHRHELSGRIKLVFQPAEEGWGGARAMVNDGVLENPAPEVVFGLHLWTPYPSGQVFVRTGAYWAAADRFEITLQGRGGHGAQPHLTVDAVVVAAHVVTALQTIASRNVDPIETVVVTVGSVEAGTTFNVIADSALLKGTVRTFLPEVQQQVQRRISEIAQGVASTFGATASVNYTNVTPAVTNDAEVTEHLRAIAVQVLGHDHVHEAKPIMVSEDVAEFLNRVPGCFFFVGAQDPKREQWWPHHHPRFDFDETMMPKGAAVLATAAADVLK